MEAGHDLLACDRKTSDPYVEVSIHGAQRDIAGKTSVVKKTLNPVWQVPFAFAFRDSQSPVTIVLTCWDKDMLGKDDFMGRASFQVSAAQMPMNQRLMLRPGTSRKERKAKGSISISLKRK